MTQESHAHVEAGKQEQSLNYRDSDHKVAIGWREPDFLDRVLNLAMLYLPAFSTTYTCECIRSPTSNSRNNK
jgi:hypothetical protein